MEVRVEDVVSGELNRKSSSSWSRAYRFAYVHQVVQDISTLHNNSTALRRRPSHGIPSPFDNINTKPYDQRRSRADRKQEREPLPIIIRLVNDGLDNIRPDHRRSAIGKTEQAEELRVQWSTSQPRGGTTDEVLTTYHIIKPRWTKLSHHRLREGVVRRLEYAKHDIVRPGFNQQNARRYSKASLPELPNVVEP